VPGVRQAQRQKEMEGEQMKVHITIKGGVTRPSYDGFVELPAMVNVTRMDIRAAVVDKLNRTSFSYDKLNYSDVIVNSVEF